MKLRDSKINTAPFFIQKKSVPIWVGIVVVTIILIFNYGNYLEIKNEQHAADFLNTNALLLATILAVTMSFTLLGLQFLAESYTPRALSWYLQDRVVYGFLILYVVFISLNLISVSMPIILQPIIFTKFAIIGTSFSLVYLVAFIYYISSKIQPERLMEDTAKRIDDNAFTKIMQNRGSLSITDSVFKPFIILEQTMIKTITNNDVFSFIQGLDILFGIMDGYITKIQQDFQTNKDGRNRFWDTYYAYGFFFRAFSPMIAECIIRGREQFIITYERYMFDEIMKIYEYRNERAIQDFWEQLDYIGQKIFDSEMRTAADLYLRRLNDLMKLELKTAAKTKEVLPKDPLGYKIRNEDETVNRILTTDLSIYRINALTNLGKKAAEKKLERLLSSIMFDIGSLIPEVLKISDKLVRRSLLYSFLSSSKQIQQASIDSGLKSLTISANMSYFTIKDMGIDREEEAGMITDNFCEIILYSIKNQQYHEIRELGVAGRMLVGNHPKIVLKVLDALEKCIEILKNEKDRELREMNMQETLKEIDSVEKWNKNHDESITTKVTQILERESQ